MCSQRSKLVSFLGLAVSCFFAPGTDLRTFQKSQGAELPDKLSGESATVRKAVRDLVLTHLIEREAEREGIVVGEDELERYIDEVQTQNNVDREGFTILLESQGLSLEEYQAQIRREILRARLISKSVRSRVNVMDSDIEKFAEQYPERIPAAGMVELEQLYFPEATDKRSEEAMENHIKAVSEALATEKRFQEVAPGNYKPLGFVHPEDLRSELRDKVEQLEPGKATGPIETTSGTYFIRLISKRNSSDLTPRLREAIKRELFEKELKVELDKYFGEELPERYDIEFKI